MLKNSRAAQKFMEDTMVTAVIFDWGGVLMRTEDYQPRLKWDSKLGVKAGYVESIVHGIAEWEMAQRGEISLEAYWRAVKDRLKLNDAELSTLQSDFYSGDRLDNHLLNLIQTLRQLGYKTGLLSNNTLDLHEFIVNDGLDKLFDAEIISAQIGIMKPDPRAYHAVLHSLDIEPHQAIFIDDSPVNIHGAREVGMHVVHFHPELDLPATFAAMLGGL